jgi:hypothetical protein
MIANESNELPMNLMSRTFAHKAQSDQWYAKSTYDIQIHLRGR